MLGNDTDEDEDTLTVTSPAPAQLITVRSLARTFGSCTYTPDDRTISARTRFDYTVSDGEASRHGHRQRDGRSPCNPAVLHRQRHGPARCPPRGPPERRRTGQAPPPARVTSGSDFIPTEHDGTSPGCLCEGWGAADADSDVSGLRERVHGGGANNMTVESFATTASSAVSVVNIENKLRVTHDYHPSPATPNLYEATVTIENISGAPAGRRSLPARDGLGHRADRLQRVRDHRRRQRQRAPLRLATTASPPPNPLAGASDIGGSRATSPTRARTTTAPSSTSASARSRRAARRASPSSTERRRPRTPPRLRWPPRRGGLLVRAAQHRGRPEARHPEHVHLRLRRRGRRPVFAPRRRTTRSPPPRTRRER